MNIELKLSIEEVNYLINVLGELPSKSGAWPLILKIKEQGDSQVTKPEAQPQLPAASSMN